MVDRAGMEILDEAACFELLAKVPVGRIVFNDRALPAVLPVNFAVIDRRVVLRTGARSRLAIAGTNTVVAFEADEFGDHPDRGAWSVVAVGLARQIVTVAELRAVRDVGLQPWAPGTTEHYLRIDIEKITGRRTPVQG